MLMRTLAFRATPPAGGGSDPTVASSVGWSEHDGSSSYTKSATIAADANRKLFACLATDTTSQTVSNVKWGGSGGTAMSLVGTSNNSKTQVNIYELAAPASGTNDLYFETNDSGSPVSAVIVVAKDAAQGAVTNTDAANDSASVVVCTLTGTSGSLLLLFSGHGYSSGSLGSPDTTSISIFTSSTMNTFAGQVVATGSAQNLTSDQGATYRHAAFALEVAAA